MVYPYYAELQHITRDMNKGNFGLWYNKFIPVNNFNDCKASNQEGDENNAAPYYRKQYLKMQKTETIKQLLDKKHLDQVAFCEAFSEKYERITVNARLQSPLITGIGESHPHEVSMVFDHNTGLPYIPASSIKGIVRFAHMLGLLDDIEPGKISEDEKGKQYLNDEAEWTHVPHLFGTQKKRGGVVFLDAYPEKVPELHVDIMNPHYGKYYGDDTNSVPPADYLDPKPIKFLTVSRGTVFVFRALVEKRAEDLVDKVRDAFTKALTEEGIGAKTAVGYGIFEDLKEKEAESVLEFIKKEKEKQARESQEAIAKAEAERQASLSEDQKLIEKIMKLKKDSNCISSVVKECLSGTFEPAVYVKLKEKLEELGEWKPSGSKQRKKKMRGRNAEIETRINP